MEVNWLFWAMIGARFGGRTAALLMVEVCSGVASRVVRFSGAWLAAAMNAAKVGTGMLSSDWWRMSLGFRRTGTARSVMPVRAMHLMGDVLKYEYPNGSWQNVLRMVLSDWLSVRMMVDGVDWSFVRRRRMAASSSTSGDGSRMLMISSLSRSRLTRSG